MKGWDGPDQGGNTQSRSRSGTDKAIASDASARAERTLLLAFLPLRWSQFAFGGVAAWQARDRLRNRRSAAAVWLGAATWSALLTRHSWQHQGYRERSWAWADVTSCATTMLAWTLVTGDIEEHDWTIGLGLSSAGAAAVAYDSPAEVLLAASALAATHLARKTVVPSANIPAVRRLVDTAFFAFFAVLGRSITGRLRASASEITSLSTQSIEQARLRAELEEQARAADQYHRGALETLKEVRARWYDPDATELRRRARREAVRLRRVLAGAERETAPSLWSQLEQLMEEFAATGLVIELVAVEVDREPADEVVDALIAAANDALSCIAAGGSGARIVMRAATGPHDALLTLRASGGDLSRLVPEDLAEKLEAVGGRAELRRSTDGVFRLTLRVSRD